MLSFDVNWIGIVIALVVNMIIGAVWYGVFANPWMAAVGKTREEIQAEDQGRRLREMRENEDMHRLRRLYSAIVVSGID